MRRILAVAVMDTWEGEWQPALGNEKAVLAHPIGEGEEVFFEYEGMNSVHKLRISREPLRLVGKIIRYRVTKDGSRATEKQPTTVEVILSNGSPSS